MASIAASGAHVASRRGCEEVIFEGRGVSRNGDVCNVPQTPVDHLLKDTIYANGHSLPNKKAPINPKRTKKEGRAAFVRENSKERKSYKDQSLRNCGQRISDSNSGLLGMVNLGHTVQRCDGALEPSEMCSVNDSLLRVGLMMACPSIGLSMVESNAVASELDPISSSALSADLDAGSAQLVASLVGPFITVFNLLFIFRIVMSWYPGIPVKKFPFFLAYNPTEPVLGPTRRLIPPVGGVDVAPVIWVALMSFANEILLGKQGLLVLLSQQQS